MLPGAWDGMSVSFSCLLSFAAVFAGLGVGAASGDYLAATATVLGVFTGSALWWLTLSVGVSLFRGKFTPRAMLWVNRISGVVIVAFGIVAVATATVSYTHLTLPTNREV